MWRGDVARAGLAYVLVAVLLAVFVPLHGAAAAAPAARLDGGRGHGHRPPAHGKQRVTIVARVTHTATGRAASSGAGCAATIALLLTVGFRTAADWSRGTVLIFQPGRGVRVIATAAPASNHRHTTATSSRQKATTKRRPKTTSPKPPAPPTSSVHMSLARPTHGHSALTLKLSLQAQAEVVRDRHGRRHRQIAAEVGGTASVLKGRSTLARAALRLRQVVTCATAPRRSPSHGPLRARLTATPPADTVTPTAAPAATGTSTGAGAPAATATGTALPAPATPVAAGSAPNQAAVTIKNFAFSPASLTIAAGTTVVWTNADAVAHTVTAADGSWGSGNLGPVATYSHTFTSPGTYNYKCAIHPFMTGAIVVTAGAPPPTDTATTVQLPAATATATPVPATATLAALSATPNPATATPTPAAVTIVDYAFSPQSLAIAPGTTVVWTNGGMQPHTVSADDGSWGSGTDPSQWLQPGATFSHTFTAPGSYTYHCDLHPIMRGTIVVSVGPPPTDTPTTTPPSDTPTVTLPPSETPTTAPSPTATPTSTSTPSPTATPTLTLLPSATPTTPPPTDTATATPVPAAATPSATATLAAPTATPNPSTPTVTATGVVIASSTPIASPTATATATNSPTATSTATPSSSPTATPSSSPTATPSSSPTATATTAPTATATAQVFAHATAVISNFSFVPNPLVISANTVVTWTNTDPVTHTVTAADASWSSGNLGQTNAYTHTFTSPGTYNYICAIHPFMHGTVIVATPTPSAALAAAHRRVGDRT